MLSRSIGSDFAFVVVDSEKELLASSSSLSMLKKSIELDSYSLRHQIVVVDDDDFDFQAIEKEFDRKSHSLENWDSVVVEFVVRHRVVADNDENYFDSEIVPPVSFWEKQEQQWHLAGESVVAD